MQTSKQQTSLFGEEDATYCQWGHLASPTAQQENDLANKTNATCGHMVIEQSKRFFPAGSFSRTFPALLIGMEGWYSMRCRLTWKLRGTKFNRLYFQLAVSTLRIEGIEYGLLPTPVVLDSGATTNLEKLDARRKRSKEKNNGKNGTKYSGNGFGTTLGELAQRKLLPTPNTNDYKSGMTNRTGGTHNQSLNDSIAQQAGTTSQLNPRFVIEMMGLPPDWTELPFLPGAKSPFMQPETP